MMPGDKVLVVWYESGHDYAPGKVVEHVVEPSGQRLTIMCHNGRDVSATKYPKTGVWFEFDDPQFVLKVYKLEEV